MVLTCINAHGDLLAEAVGYRLETTMSLYARVPLISALLMAALACTSAGAADTDSPPQRLSFEWNARARFESVDDAAFAKDAQLLSVRQRAGIRLRANANFSALVEGEWVATAGDDFNSGANGRIDRPAIIDPRGVELNQAWIGWNDGPFKAMLGRQRILIDNQRWIGNSGWRQNEQTFDASVFEWQPSPAFALQHVFFDRVHRINGDDARDPLARERELSSHLVDLRVVQAGQNWGAYVLAHDDQDVAAASTQTLGARWNGKHVIGAHAWNWRIDLAQQQDYGDNPANFSHQYWLLESGLNFGRVNWRAGYEHLGGDGRHALQTPLATLHAFNGWADRFLVTPADGLEDRYLGAGGALGQGERSAKMQWALTWHDLRADHGHAHYGSEWNASLSFPIAGKLTALAKLADYSADEFSRDSTKFWLQLEWAL